MRNTESLFVFNYKVTNKIFFVDVVFVISYFSLQFSQLFLRFYAKELYVSFLPTINKYSKPYHQHYPYDPSCLIHKLINDFN